LWRISSSFCNRWALVGLLAGLLMSVLAAWQVDRNNHERIQVAVDQAAQQTLNDVLERIRLYQYGLRGARGAVQTAGEDGINRELFLRYSRTRDTDVEFPGARGFGFIRRVAADDVEAFVRRARADGWPDFRVRELSANTGTRFLIQYIEPVERNLQAVGLDIASERNRREAAQAAVRTGTVQLTGPITLVQATGNPQQSFLILIPVYRGGVTPATEEERERLAFGWSYAPLLMKEVLADLHIDHQRAHLELVDITRPESAEVFFNSAESGGADLYTRVSRHEVFGRVWEARFSVHPEFIGRLHLTAPLELGGVCVLISVLVAALIGAVSDSRRHRRQILEEQGKLAAIVEGSADGIIGCDLEGNITSWNRGAEHLLGYRAFEVMGRSMLALTVPEELKEEYTGILLRIRRGESMPHFETERLRKDGSRVSVSLTISPILGSDGAVVGASKTVRDISQQKAQEAWVIELNSRLENQVAERTAELARMNVLFSNVMRAATEVSIVATDLHGTIQVFNRGAERLLGYWADEMIGRATPAVFHLSAEVEERGRQLSEESGSVIEGFEVFVYHPSREGFEVRDWTYVRKDGSHFPVSLVVTSMRNEQGDLVGYLGIATDITDQRRHSAELIAARDQLLMAADIAELGIWSWELDNNSLHWNDKMFELYQQSPDLVGGGLSYEHWCERIHPQDLDKAQNAVKAAAAGDVNYSIIFRIIRPDGDIRYIQACGYSERNAHGQVVRVLGINRDITDQHELESWLRQAKEQADAASAAKSTFLANMSHEIRTPMNAILGMLQLVQQTGLNTRQNDYIGKAQIAARSLLRLLNDILDYSKIDAGKLELDRHPFVLEQLMEELAIVLDGNQGDKTVELIFDLDEHLPVRVLGDQLRLQQVLINLASNALKFTETGEVCVRMLQLARDGGRCHIRFEIEDTGIGINEDQLQRIFEGFSQAEASTARRFGGSGLGLVISKHLLEMMGSQLQVRSAEGCGSCFWFELWISMADARPWLNQPIFANRRWRVLMIEPNQHNREVFGRYCSGLGAEVQAVATLEECRQRLWPDGRSHLPTDLILLNDSVVNKDPRPFIHELGLMGCQNLLLLNRTGSCEWLEADEGQIDGVRFRQLARPLTPNQLARSVRILLRGDDRLPVTKPQHSLRLQGVHLLLVEDNPVNRQVAAELLSAEGARVDMACGGLEGVERIAANPGVYDLVLMDMQMPDIDGLEATRRIRQLPDMAALPIVAMTANVASNDIQACLAAGMNDHLGKPVDTERMVSTILKWLPSGVSETIKARQILMAEQSHASVHEYSVVENPLSAHLRAVIREYFGGDSQLYCQMLAMFEPNVQDILQQLESAKRADDVPGIKAALHTLKGTAATMGAQRLSQLAAEQEQVLKSAPEPEADLFSGDVISQLHHLVNEELAELSAAMADLMLEDDARQVCSDPEMDY
jgi:PAS domain S-box-containing protein